MELDLVTIVMLLVGLLFAASVISLVAARVRFPYTVILVIFGFGVRTIFADWDGFQFLQSEISTDVVFFIFLPTLLFESSFNLDSKVLFRNIVPVLTLAIPAFLLSTAIVGYLGSWALGIPLVTALLFGALISATDPVAVVALFKELGAPKRLMVLVEGESLFNDATAIVLFNVLLLLAAGGAAATLSVPAAVIEFLRVFTGGIAVGAVLAFTFAQILSFVRDDELVEITLTTIVAYMSFIVAEHYLHVSGVMATATAGMILGGWGRTKISPKVGHFMHSFWEYLSFIANSLIFLLVGLALSPELIREFIVALVLAIPIVYFARAVSIAVAVPMVNATNMIEPIDRRYQAVMYWGGLRGALALALALSLPPDFAARELILVSAMGVVMATLLVNALTIGTLLRLLGLDQLSPAEMLARFESLLVLKRETRNRVAKFAEEKAIAPTIVQRIQQDYLSGEARLEAERESCLADGGELSELDRMQVLASQALGAEKKHYWEEFYEGNLTETAYKQLAQDVDHQADHVKVYGRLPETFEEASTRESPLDRLLYRLGIFRAYLQKRKVGQIANHFEEKCAETLAARSVVTLLDRLLRDSSVDEDSHATIRGYYQNRHDKAQRELTAMATDYPEYVERTQEYLLTRSCLHNEETSLNMLRELGLVPDKVYLEQKAAIEARFERLRARPVETLRLDPESLIAHIPLFEHCGEEGIRLIAGMLESESFAEGDKIVRQGESGESMYVIARGTVQVLREDGAESRLLAILTSGGFFGEIALLAESPRTATVRAATPCTMLRLRRKNLDQLMNTYSEIRDDVQRAHKERLAAMAALAAVGDAPPAAGEVSPA